jgi:hypothetical protein
MEEDDDEYMNIFIHFLDFLNFNKKIKKLSNVNCHLNQPTQFKRNKNILNVIQIIKIPTKKINYKVFQNS